MATFYWDKAYRDPLLADAQKETYADKGLEAVDKALQCKPDYLEAIISKGLLYRVKASVTPRTRRTRQQFLEQAQTLQKQAMELRKEQQAAQAAPRRARPRTCLGRRRPRGRSEVTLRSVRTEYLRH